MFLTLDHHQSLMWSPLSFSFFAFSSHSSPFLLILCLSFSFFAFLSHSSPFLLILRLFFSFLLILFYTHFYYVTLLIYQIDNKTTVITVIAIGSVLLLFIGIAFGTALYCRERKLKDTYEAFFHSSGLVGPSVLKTTENMYLKFCCNLHNK